MVYLQVHGISTSTWYIYKCRVYLQVQGISRLMDTKRHKHFRHQTSQTFPTPNVTNISDCYMYVDLYNSIHIDMGVSCHVDTSPSSCSSIINNGAWLHKWFSRQSLWHCLLTTSPLNRPRFYGCHSLHKMHFDQYQASCLRWPCHAQNACQNLIYHTFAVSCLSCNCDI